MNGFKTGERQTRGTRREQFKDAKPIKGRQRGDVNGSQED